MFFLYCQYQPWAYSDTNKIDSTCLFLIICWKTFPLMCSQDEAPIFLTPSVDFMSESWLSDGIQDPHRGLHVGLTLYSYIPSDEQLPLSWHLCSVILGQLNMVTPFWHRITLYFSFFTIENDPNEVITHLKS